MADPKINEADGREWGRGGRWGRLLRPIFQILECLSELYESTRRVVRRLRLSVSDSRRSGLTTLARDLSLGLDIRAETAGRNGISY